MSICFARKNIGVRALYLLDGIDRIEYGCYSSNRTNIRGIIMIFRIFLITQTDSVREKAGAVFESPGRGQEWKKEKIIIRF